MPSRFDVQKESVIVEGKSDYYTLRYSARMLGRPDFPLLPGLGAGTFGALVAIHLGWGLRCLFILDGDRQGKSERERYIREYGMASDRIATINEFVDGISEIEDLVDAEAKNVIKTEMKLAAVPTKKQIARYFQERLASDSVVELGSGFASASKLLLDAIEKRLRQWH